MDVIRRQHFELHFIELNKDIWIPIKISSKFVPMGPFNNIPGLIWILNQ